MVAGREMGAGWLVVDADAIIDDDALTSWIDVALDHNRATAERP